MMLRKVWAVVGGWKIRECWREPRDSIESGHTAPSLCEWWKTGLYKLGDEIWFKSKLKEIIRKVSKNNSRVIVSKELFIEFPAISGHGPVPMEIVFVAASQPASSSSTSCELEKVERSVAQEGEWFRCEAIYYSRNSSKSSKYWQDDRSKVGTWSS